MPKFSVTQERFIPGKPSKVTTKTITADRVEESEWGNSLKLFTGEEHVGTMNNVMEWQKVDTKGEE